MAYDVTTVKMEKEFKICPTCGYEDGFHSMFKKDGSINQWLFSCPACHNVFDIGYSV